MAEPGRKLSGKKTKGRRTGLKTQGRKKEIPSNVRSREVRSKPGQKKRGSISHRKFIVG